MSQIRLNNQTVGNVGLYFVCYQLSLRGWNVMPTARNARGVDILAYSDDASRTLSFQVKALSKKYPVPWNPAQSVSWATTSSCVATWDRSRSVSS